jgi:hypothetical protein
VVVAEHADLGAQRLRADVVYRRQEGVRIGRPVVDDDHATQIGRERGEQSGGGIGPVLDRDDDGDVPRPGPGAVRNRVHHPAVEQAPGQCPGGGVGDREPAAREQRAPGRGEPEHARGCAAEQHPPAVERDDVPVDDDVPAVGQDRVRRRGADVARHTLRRLGHSPIVASIVKR